ncbi:MAG: hypothetical protein P8046_05510 [Anaerolineales bacterium]
MNEKKLQIVLLFFFAFLFLAGCTLNPPQVEPTAPMAAETLPPVEDTPTPTLEPTETVPVAARVNGMPA